MMKFYLRNKEMLKATMRKLILLCDRYGLRWVPSFLLPVLGRRLSDGVRNLSYDGGWVHKFDNISSVEPSPRLRGYHLLEKYNQHIWGFLYTPKIGDVIIDVGAGLGAESLYYANAVGPSGRVIGIEAHPTICHYLKKSLEINNMAHAEALNIAVADKPQTVLIENNLENYLGNAILQGTGSVPVEALPLSMIATQQKINNVDFLKMNIEGAERLALDGMSELIQRTSFVSISCHDFKYKRTGNEFFQTKKIVEGFFRDNGFIFVPRQDQNTPELEDQVNAFNPNLIPLHHHAELKNRGVFNRL
jgi:FkbM family methyltransferase